MQQKDFYNFAKDETGAVTDIATIDESSRHRSKFFCIGCGEEMVPVLGQRRRHHFRHKSLTVNCSYETYLHQLGKEKFKKAFDAKEPIPFTFYAEHICSQVEKCPFKEALGCKEHRHVKKTTYNLSDFYTTCEPEKTYQGWRADLLFTSPKGSHLFFEIAVSHDCDPQKIVSGIKIIELKVKDDNDLTKSLAEEELPENLENALNPYGQQLPRVRFFNFQRKNHIDKGEMPMHLVRGIKDVYGFIAGFELIPMGCRDIAKKLQEMQSIGEFGFAVPEIKADDQEMKAKVFAIGAWLAIKRKISVKHCAFCAYSPNGMAKCISFNFRHYLFWGNKNLIQEPCLDFSLTSEGCMQSVVEHCQSVLYWDLQAESK